MAKQNRSIKKAARIATQKQQRQAAKRAALDSQKRAKAAAAAAEAEWKAFEAEYKKFEAAEKAKANKQHIQKTKAIGMTFQQAVQQQRQQKKLEKSRKARQANLERQEAERKVKEQRKRNELNAKLYSMIVDLSEVTEPYQKEYSSNKYISKYNDILQDYFCGEDIEELDELENMVEDLLDIKDKVTNENFKKNLESQDKKIQKEFNIPSERVKDYRMAIKIFCDTVYEYNINPSDCIQNLYNVIENGIDPALLEEMCADPDSVIFTGTIYVNDNWEDDYDIDDFD